MNDFDEKFEQENALKAVSDISENSAISGETAEISDNNAADDSKNNGFKPFANAVEWVCTIVFTAAAVVLLNLFVFRGINVDGSSMCNTLQDGDKVLIVTSCFKAEFGDIVVIQADKLLNRDTGLYGEPIIKRVIGTAGDTIRFNLEKGEVYRNGKVLKEDYITGPTVQKYNGWVESGVDYVVPENCVFVLGDNRRVSHDSRDLKTIGFVDENYIMGKAFVRIFPFDDMKLL